MTLLTMAFSLFAPLANAELPLKVAKLERTTPVDFGKEVMPILKRNCLACHQKAEAEGGLILESLASILKGGDSGTAVIANDATTSLLMTRTTGEVEPLMPPEDNDVGAAALTPEELGLLQLWIEQGAPGSDDAESESIIWQPISETMRSVYAMDVSPDGERFAFGRGNRVLVADLNNPTDISSLVDSSLVDSSLVDSSLVDSSLGDSSPGLGPVADVDLIQSIAFSPDGNRIATGGFRSVRLWKRTYERLNDTNKPLSESGQAFHFAQGMAVDETRTNVAIVNAIGDVEVWDLETDARRVTIGGQRDRTTGLAWAGVTNRLILANESGRVSVHDGIGGDEMAAIDLKTSIKRLTTCSDGVHLAVIDQERRVQLLRLIAASGETPASVVVVHQSVVDVADATGIALLSQPTLMIAVASESRGVVLVDPVTNQVARTIGEDAIAGAIVDSIALSRDETKLVTGSRDAAARIWSVADGKLLATCQGTHTDQLSVAKATRDAARQKASVAKLASKTTELQELLKKEDEALAAIIQARDQADAANTANEAKRVEGVALVATTQAAIEKSAADIAAAENATAENATADIAAVENAAAENAAAENAAAESAAAENAIAAAKAVAEKATKDLEAQRAAVTKAEAEKAKSEAELVKQQRSVDAATNAQQRATAAIPAHQSIVETEARRLTRLDQSLIHAQQQIAMPGNELVDISLSTDATRLATMHRDGSSTVYRTSDGQAVTQFPPTIRSGVTGLTQPNRNQIAILDNQLCRLAGSGPIECWSLQEQWVLERKIGAIDDAKTIVNRVTALDFRPDGMTLAVGTGEPSRSGIVKIFAVETGELVRDLGELHTDTVLGLDFARDGRTLASCSADRTIRLLDVASGSTIRTLEGHTHHVLSVAWQDDGRTLASASADQSIKIWDSETGETSRTIIGFSRELTSIRFVASTDQVAASCGSGQVRLANATSGATVRTFDAAKDFLFTVALTPDATRLIAGGESGVVRIWNVADGAVVAELKP